MNYHNHHINMTTAAMQQPSSASISLPPISTIDFHSHQAHHNPPEVLQPPQPPRQLPPLTHQHYYNTARLPQEPQYVQQRPMYANMPGAPSYHPMVGGRMQLPSTADPNMMMTPARVSKQKDVKRRTKTGCLTCRKRRIKVREGLLFSSIPCLSTSRLHIVHVVSRVSRPARQISHVALAATLLTSLTSG